MNTTRVWDAYKKHESQIQSLKKKYENCINPDLPFTNKVLSQFARRSDKIFKAMIFCAKDDDYYTAAILFRSLVEHFFRGFYIMARTVKEKNDSVAENFEKLLFVAEYYDEQKSIHKKESIENKQKRNFKQSDFVSDLYAKGYDKANEKQIDDIREEYRIGNLITWFYENQTTVNNIVLGFIPDYNRLCSYTHAGSIANFRTETLTKDKTLNKELNEILQNSLTCSGVAKENIFTTYIFDEPFIYELKLLQQSRKINIQ